MTKTSYLYQGRMEDGLCIYCGRPGRWFKNGAVLSECRRHIGATYPGDATCPQCGYWGLYRDTPTLVRCSHCDYTAPFPQQ